MKKFRKSILVILLAFVICCIFAACDDGNNGEENVPYAPEYTIQYSDGSGTKRITVEQGQPYSISSIPQKTGYTFIGLFDAEVGGTQYITATGSSVSPFNDDKSLVLYPQFKVKEYTVVLDYQGAPITGNREFVVEYGSKLPELPKNLSIEHKIFTGWYTSPNQGGNKVADQYGLIPKVSVVNASNFSLPADGYISLYAGFEWEKYTVTFYFKEGMPPEELEVKYGTEIKNVSPKTRVDGKVPISWATNSAGTDIFNGKITEEKVLYAAEYAPVIDFDANGGNAVSSLVARAGASISMPTPKRTNYTFIGWKTSDGTVVSYNTMPGDSTELKAVWQANIVFDSNGGTKVNAISQSAGTEVTLPSTEREGYAFAGWYTADNKEYTDTVMPETSVVLKAGWYKFLSKTFVLIPASEYYGSHATPNSPVMGDASHELDLTDIYNAGITQVKVTANYRVCYGAGYNTSLPQSSSMDWFTEYSATGAYNVWSYSETHIKYNDWQTQQRTTDITLTSGKLYVCRYKSAPDRYPNDQYACWNDFYVIVEYPDMTKLY